MICSFRIVSVAMKNLQWSGTHLPAAEIASLRVVDVRQKICGAVVQEMDSKKEKIKVGDRLQVDAQPDVSLR